MSIQDIRQNPQDLSNFYLANIYQTISDPSLSIPPASPPAFSPPTYAVWVNALWFLSLVISLTCALLATLLQQWARKYLKVTQSRYSPHKRARIRAFLSEGVEKLLILWTVEALPTLLHISLFLFFAGLVVFLWDVNLTIFKLVLSLVGVCTALYGSITVMPVFRHDSPYHTPLSLPAWHIITGIPFLTFRALRKLPCLHWHALHRFHHLARRYGERLAQGMQKTVEETALKSPSEVDTRAFLWTFDCLDEDHELERFFYYLPSFRNSKVVKDPFSALSKEGKQRLFTAMTGLLDRTFSSDLLSEAVKKRRAIICTQAVDPAHTPEAFTVLNIILSRYQFSDPLVAEIVQIVRGWEINMDRGAISYAKATFSKIVARVQPHHDTWFILASKSLGIPELVLRNYAAHGDSLSLAVLIHVTRQQFSHFWNAFWPDTEFSKVLEEASKFNVEDTSPELRHKFCALWNQIVRKVQNDNDRRMTFLTLGRIRNIYMALHQATDSVPKRFSAFTGDRDPILWEPSSYLLCSVPDHHPDSTPRAYDNSASATFVHAVPDDHDNSAPGPSLLSSSQNTPSSSTHLHRVDECLTEAPPRNSVITSFSLQPIDQIATESHRTPVTLPNPATARATLGIIDTMNLSTPEPSASTSPPESRALASPPDTVDVEHSADSHAPSIDVPSSPSPTQVLPTGPPLTSDFTVIGTDHTSSSLEYLSPMLAPGAPSPSRLLHPSASDMGAVSEGESSVKPAFCMEKDAPHPPLKIREDSMADPDLPPQSLSPPPIIDVAIAGRSHSQSSLDVEHTADHPSHPLHGQFDGV